jgi:hypothetical protein
VEPALFDVLHQSLLASERQRMIDDRRCPVETCLIRLLRNFVHGFVVLVLLFGYFAVLEEVCYCPWKLECGEWFATAVGVTGSVLVDLVTEFTRDVKE